MIEHEWDFLRQGVDAVLGIKEIEDSIDHEHIAETPKRVVEMYKELFSGCFMDPEEVLRKGFKNDTYNEMIYMNDISFVSVCAHHWAPFFGKAHFAYIPNGKIVGFSKMPRLVKIYAKRPQVQEKLTQEIVDTFNRIIQPKGCGLVMEAEHLCMKIRGVKEETAYSRTTALRGVFMEPLARDEFLNGIRPVSKR